MYIKSNMLEMVEIKVLYESFVWGGIKQNVEKILFHILVRSYQLALWVAKSEEGFWQVLVFTKWILKSSVDKLHLKKWMCIVSVWGHSVKDSPKGCTQLHIQNSESFILRCDLVCKRQLIMVQAWRFLSRLTQSVPDRWGLKFWDPIGSPDSPILFTARPAR